MAITAAELMVRVGGDTADAERKLDLIGKKTGMLQRMFGGMGGAIASPFRVAGKAAEGLVNGLAKIGFAAMGVSALKDSVTGLMNSMIAGNQEFEVYEAQFKTLLGSSEAAKKRLEELAIFGQKTPFELPGVVQASKVLQVFGGDVLATGKNLELVGDMAAAANQPIEGIAMWIGRLYDAMQNGQPFGEAAMRLQELGLLSGDVRRKLEQMTKEGKSGAEVWAYFSDTMREKFGGMMEEQSKTMEGMLSNLSDWWENTKRIIGEPIFDVVKQNLGSLLDFLGSDQVMQATQQFALYLAQGIQTAIQWGGQAVAWFQENWPTIQAVGEQVFTAVQATIEAVQPVIIGLIDVAAQVVEYVATNWPTIQATVEEVMNAIQVVTGDILGQVQQWWNENGAQVMETVQMTFAAVMEFIANALAFVKEETSGALGFLNEWWQKHGESIRIIIEFIVQVITTAFNAIVSLFQSTGDQQTSIWARVWDDIKTILGATLNIIGDILDAFAALIQGDWQGLGDALKNIWQDVWTLIKAVFDASSAVISAAVQALSGLLQSIWQGLKDYYTSKWDEMWGSVQATLQHAKNSVVSLISNLVGNVRSRWGEMKSALESMWREMWNAIRDTLIRMSDNVKRIITGFGQSVRDIWLWLKGALSNIWENAWNEIKGQAVTQKERLLQIMRDAVNRIRNAFNIDWGGIGRAIIDGITGGVRNAAGNLANAAAEAARAALDAAKRALGISSPSREFMLVGKNIVDGLALGIKKHEDVAGEQLRRLLDLRKAAIRQVASVSMPEVRWSAVVKQDVALQTMPVRTAVVGGVGSMARGYQVHVHFYYQPTVSTVSDEIQAAEALEPILRRALLIIQGRVV